MLNDRDGRARIGHTNPVRNKKSAKDNSLDPADIIALTTHHCLQISQLIDNLTTKTFGNINKLKNQLILYPIAYTPIERHVKVKGDASPDDPSLKEYWEKRHQKFGKSYWERNSRNYKIAQNQSWKCPVCGEPLFNGEEIETHHIVPVTQGGLDDLENLQHLHKACHKQEHSKTKFSRLK